MKPACVLVLLASVAGCVSVQDSGGGSRFVQSLSPTAMGEAIFTKEIGMQDSAVTFSVLDPKKGKKPIEVGFVGDAGWKGIMPRAAVWSQDGSVIAVQGADFKSWSHAYDFKNSRIIENSTPPFQGNIAKLLNARGGVGPKVLRDWTKFDQVARPVAEQR